MPQRGHDSYTEADARPKPTFGRANAAIQSLYCQHVTQASFATVSANNASWQHRPPRSRGPCCPLENPPLFGVRGLNRGDLCCAARTGFETNKGSRLCRTGRTGRTGRTCRTRRTSAFSPGGMQGWARHTSLIRHSNCQLSLSARRTNNTYKSYRSYKSYKNSRPSDTRAPMRPYRACAARASHRLIRHSNR